MFSKLFSILAPDQKPIDLSPQVVIHYGIPSSASRLAYDPIQQLLAIGTTDGRIKVVGQDYIEGFLTSSKEIPFKNLEFLQNQGLLISISSENNIEVWDLDNRYVASSLQWESNITAFSLLQETNYMYVGDESGLVSVLKYESEGKKLLRMPYNIPAHSVNDAAGVPSLNRQSVVGVLPQPCSNGNRVLLAYGNGVIALWDVRKYQLLFFGRNSDNNPIDSSVEQNDKVIASVCWASSDGSVVAVGYVNGDIIFWNFSDVGTTKDKKSGKTANDMIKLQLSSAKDRFPVIALQWFPCGNSNDVGLLFVCGGDEIGSTAVLAILRLEWSFRKDALKNHKRSNLSLEGSFADMILVQDFSVMENKEAPSLIILTNPGQLQYHDSSYLSTLFSWMKAAIIPIQYRNAVTTTKPCVTIGKLISVQGHIKDSEALLSMTSAAESGGSSRWPINGGVPYNFPPPKERVIERLYVAGYQDGSVRIWDVTYPVLSPLHIIDPEVKCKAIDGVNSSVCALAFSSETLSLAVGNESGMIRLYHLSRDCNESGFHVVRETKSEVCSLDRGTKTFLSAVFILSTSSVCTLRYTNFGARLVAGYESGQVVMLNVDNSSVLFRIESPPSPCSPIISFTPPIIVNTGKLTKSEDLSEPQEQSETSKELIFTLRNDSHVAALDSSDGSVILSFPQMREESTAISVYILEGAMCIAEMSGGKCPPSLSEEEVESGVASVDDEGGGANKADTTSYFTHNIDDLQILVCCTDVLQMYTLKSVIQELSDSVHEVNLLKNCCWTATFRKDEKECVLIVLYQCGSIEIRSLPNLDVLSETSLMSILRWSFETNMDKTMSCTEYGHISLVNGCEFVVLSLLAGENNFRIPQSLPRLYDKALAAALDLDYSISENNDNDDTEESGLFGGIMKGLRANKESQSTDSVPDQKPTRSPLDDIFSRSGADICAAASKAAGVIELKIDDIDIDGPLRISPISDGNGKKTKDHKTERKELLEGGTSDGKPKQRTVDEIKSKYRKPGEMSAAALAAKEARDKLLERKEKLQRVEQNSEELRDNAESFASLAKQLKEKQQNRKWWQLP